MRSGTGCLGLGRVLTFSESYVLFWRYHNPTVDFRLADSRHFNELTILSEVGEPHVNQCSESTPVHLLSS